MDDLFHYFGSDLSVSPTGDLQPVSDTVKGQQRVLRRLLTNPGDYIWEPDYGAGVPQWIGRTLDIPKITALIRGQMLLEEAVAKIPEPQITVQEIANGLSVSISYTDAPSNTPQTLQFDVTP